MSVNITKEIMILYVKIWILSYFILPLYNRGFSIMGLDIGIILTDNWIVHYPILFR